VTDRSQAISLVEAALKAGRIVQADHDMRIDQIKNASSDQEIDMVVRDLTGHQHTGGPDSQWAQGAAAGAGTTASPPTSGQPWPLVNYGPTQGQPVEISTLAAGAGKKIGGIIALVVVLSVIVPIAGVIIGLVSARDTFEDLNFGEPVDETTYLPGQEPGENGVNVLTTQGFDDLVGALTEETGSTTVFGATLYPRYAVLEVPEQETGKRYHSYYWDGRALVANDFKSTTDAPRLDLATVDPAVMITLVEDVRGRVEDPTSWYVNIDSIANEGARMSAYASNEYNEGAYVVATLEGEIIYESEYGG
jgi:hypothetical protein